MLLPSAFPAGPRPRLARMGAFGAGEASHLSPPETPNTSDRIDGACNRLQSMLGTRMLKNSTNLDAAASLYANARVIKRPPPPARYQNRRKRKMEEDLDGEDEAGRVLAGHGYGLEIRMEDVDGDGADPLHQEEGAVRGKISTPKRMRRAPPSIPFGLEHDDFLGLDEGIDEEMAESVFATRRVPDVPLDEGYGSMEFEPGQLRSALAVGALYRTDRLRSPNRHVYDLGSRLHSQSCATSDLDSMSVGTPFSGTEAVHSPGQTLSPLQGRASSFSPNLAMPDMTLADANGSLMPDGLPSQNEALMSPFEMDTSSSDDVDEPPLPTLASVHAHTSHISDRRPTLPRLPSLAHSEIFLPTPCTPTHPSYPSHPQSDPLFSPTAVGSARPVGREPEAASIWTDDDDRALVALVVDKLRLKKSDWDACARALGADGYGASLGRRWRELVGDGCVGLKFRFGGAVVPRWSTRGGSGGGDGGRDDREHEGIRNMGRRITGGVRATRGDVRAVRWDEPAAL